MASKEARLQGVLVRYRRWFSWGGLVVAVMGLTAAVHWLSDTPPAGAQPPQAARNQANQQARQASAPARASAPRNAAPAANGRPVIPKIVAVVNGEKITKDELGKACLWRYGQEVLESMINKQLILQECQRTGIVVSDAEVEEEISRIAGKFGLSPDRWLTMLKQERHITPAQYRREIIWPTLALRRLAAAQLKVTPEEIQQAFESEFGPKVKARLIAVSSKKKAELVLAKAKAKPQDFGRMAKEYSEDPSASRMGIVPPIRRHMGVPQLEAAAFALEEGQVSDIIQVDDRYVILQCERHIPPTYIADRFRKDAENRLADQIRDNKMRTAAADLFERLQKQAKVVNVYNNEELRKKMPGVAATINGRALAITQLTEECLIRYGAEVLEGEINRKLLTQSLRSARQQVTQDDIDAEIARAAASFGYVTPDGQPDVAAWLRKVQEEDGATVELYVYDVVWPSVALKKLVPQDMKVTQEDLQRAFEANYGPRVEALAIVVGSQRTAQRVWEMARSNPSDQFFGELAHQYSIDPVSRANMGEIPPIRKHGGQPLIEKAAFSLQPGEISGIIATGDEYVILKCRGFTKPIITQMDAQVRSELEQSLREQKLRQAMAAKFESLHRSARIENFIDGTLQGPTSVRSAGAAGATRR